MKRRSVTTGNDIASAAVVSDAPDWPPDVRNGRSGGAGDAVVDVDTIDDDAFAEVLLPNRDRLIAEAVALAGEPDLGALVELYWRLVPDEELAGRTPAGMVATTRSHRELARQRVPGELGLAVTTPEGDGHTVVQIVTDDMPFLVDSMTATLSNRGLEIHILVHPQVVVRREVMGQLTEIRTDVEPDDATRDDIVESWMHIEVDRLRDQTQRDELYNDVARVFTDVREVVEDWPKMHRQALELADELVASDLPVPDKDITDAVELLRWLADDQFTFLGYREYELTDGPQGEKLLCAGMGTGLGVLRKDQTAPRVLSSMAPEAYEKVLEQRLLIITKANSRATVHRHAYLDYIGFKTFDNDGNVVGERRFLGLFTSAAYLHSVRELPVVRRKVAEVLERSGLPVRSHSGKDLMAILETYPRDELFQISTDQLYHTVMGVLRLAGRRQVRLFVRPDAYGRFMSCLCYLPRDRFTTQNRLRIQDILLRRLNGVGVDNTTRVTETTLARIHFIVRTDPSRPPRGYDVEAIQQEIAEATRLWDDDFRLALERKVGDAHGRELYYRYVNAYSQTYKDEHTPYEAVQDIAKLELLDEPGELAMQLYRRRKNDDDVRFKVFRYGEAMMLSTVLPVLHSLGVQVTDERPYEIARVDGRIYLYDFGLRLPAGCLALSQVRPKVENAFQAAWRQESEVDGLNELVLRAGLTWRQVVVLRAYAKYLRQTGTVYSQDYMDSTLVAFPRVASLLVLLFEARFDPALPGEGSERKVRTDELVDMVRTELDAVASLDQDRILRSYLTLMLATQRTSFFQRSSTDRGGGRPKPYIAFKLDPQQVPDLPKPRPRHEIFVYSPRFEGVHLRFGAVARGGLRWSDRREDFRTEVLGLVKAQMVKNAVIVPVGAKGGFVLKQAPPAANRDAYLTEGKACYRMFISALLDVTDNLTTAVDGGDGGVVPPPNVVRHDGDDPYLVVAADKGTATFSDTANEIAISYGFWLGDAFASGGSVGYDHKKMGITARGAWESVREHFREMGVDTQSQEFTVVGIGDMSGDVFGNGMLCSPHIRLVAAFDHRHVFVDPRPEAAPSFAERQRLFGLPRSSWDDYDRSLISAGGGVWPRSAKAIPISPEVREALGIDDPAVTTLPPPEVIKAILRAPVDLLWNGGIGTYVKARDESHGDVGDKANDQVRVDGRELHCKVVAEGGNLGITQRGRIEYALAGGRVNTDFIDNTAGVDCSDREVNIKILLNRGTTGDDLSEEQRRELLAEMTDEVAALVLRDNYDQATALANARAQAVQLLPVHRRLITSLERIGRLDRDLEALPDEEELTARTVAGTGLTSPELAVLLAYVKIVLEDEVLASSLPDEAWTTEPLTTYFPVPLRKRFSAHMAEHALRREIVTTQLVNEVVNNGGTSFVYRTVEETAASEADVVRAYVIVREVFGLRDLWRAVERLDNKVPAAAQTAVRLEARRLLDRAVRWLLQSRRIPLDVAAETARLRPGIAALLPDVVNLFRGREREALLRRARKLVALGAPEDLAQAATGLLYGFGLLDVVEVARKSGHDVAEVASIYYVLSERFRVDEILDRISELPREDRWQTLARTALRYDLYAALAAITADVLATTPPEPAAAERVDRWEDVNRSSIARVRQALRDFGESRADLAVLSVLLRQVRTVVRTASLEGEVSS